MVDAYRIVNKAMPNPPKQPQFMGSGQETQKLVTDSMVGLVFGDKYRILSEISKGGMGRIFKAEQIALKRDVAIKVIMASDDYVANQRFLLEASLTANLDHPNIVRIFDFGRTDDGILFLVMELLAGKNMEAWVKSSGALTVKEALAVGKQLCGALAEAHQKNVIHRDIKPSNIIINRRPGAGMMAKLIDFGLVKSVDQHNQFSRTGVVMGTPMYMAPEQISAKGVDDRVDVYALGLTLYFALTGQVPYPERGVNSLMHAQLNEEVQPMHELVEDLTDDHLVNWIIRTAVAKDQKDRFQNTLQMLQSMEICEQHLGSDTYPTLSLQDGVLHVDGEALADEEHAPVAPLVDPNSYVKDGSAISNDFANTLSLSGIYEHEPVVSGLSGSNTSPTEPVTAAHGATGGSKGIVLAAAALVVLMLVGLGIGLVVTGTFSSSQVPVVQQQVSVEVNSDPEAVDVYRDGNLVGSTPFSIQLAKDQTANIELKKKGYESRSVVLSDSTPKVTIRLEKLAPVEEAAPAPTRDSKAVTPKRAKPATPKTNSTKPKSPAPVETKSNSTNTEKKTLDGSVRDPWAD